MLTISIVLYKNDPKHIIELCKSLAEVELPFKAAFFDNSPNDNLYQYIKRFKGFDYRWSNTNVGYGSAHNIFINEALDHGKYHLAMNPDIYFKKGTIEKIVAYMDQEPEVGLLLPRVLNPDDSEQPLFKLLPDAKILFLRRFAPKLLKRLFNKDLKLYSLEFVNSQKTFDAPYLSGCFMFLRKKALKEVGVFDSRFFLYFEDVDLSRRIRVKWRTTYYADASIYHYFQRGSYNKPKLLIYHTISAVKYFKKYGWFKDKERTRINQETLDQLQIVHSSKKHLKLNEI